MTALSYTCCSATIIVADACAWSIVCSTKYYSRHLQSLWDTEGKTQRTLSAKRVFQFYLGFSLDLRLSCVILWTFSHRMRPSVSNTYSKSRGNAWTSWICSQHSPIRCTCLTTLNCCSPTSSSYRLSTFSLLVLYLFFSFLLSFFFS